MDNLIATNNCPDDFLNEIQEDNDLKNIVEENGFSRTRYDLLNGCVPVNIEIGRLNLPLNDLIKMRFGDSISVAEYPVSVRLRSSDSYFAEGVLVDVNGKIAVKITRVY
jgi:flagellar motor switch/type III secretory pathway protein FliN